MRLLALSLVVWLCAGCLGTTANPRYETDAGDGSAGNLDGSGAGEGGGPDAGRADGSVADGHVEGGDVDAGDGGPDGSADGGADAGDACTKQAWYLDEDKDGYGSGAATWACEKPAGNWTDNADDAQPQCGTNDNECSLLTQQCTDADTWQVCSLDAGCLHWTSYLACGLMGRVCGADAGTCVACTGSDDCGEAKPVCTDDNRCVQCVNDGDCTGEAGFCQDEVCVECLGDGDCAGKGGLCDAGACVECKGDSDCSADAPLCDGGACGGCTGVGDCSRFTGAPVCDAAGGGACVECLPGDETLCDGDTPMCASDGIECVECNADSDCGDPAAARCDGHVCVPCSADGSGESGCQGVQREGRRAEVCLADAGGNLCVECDVDADCDAEPGDLASGDELCTAHHYCVGGTEGSAGLCETCYDDRQCPTQSACIAVDPGSDSVTPAGECVPYRDSDVACAVPSYLGEQEEVDVLGESRLTCRPQRATCEEMLLFGTSCPDPGAAADDLCVSDGVSGIWTIQCYGLNDCPSANPCTAGLCKF